MGVQFSRGEMAKFWTKLLLTKKHQAETWPLAVARRPSGFADQEQRDTAADFYGPTANRKAAAAATLGGPLPFPSTGPRGHRSRLRARLLERGPDSLADYEMLEMLLFFAQPKGDTKPLAKGLINKFGSFANVLFASTQTLFDEPGLGEHSVAALKLVQAAAVRLARSEVIDRPIVNNMDRLMDYLSSVLSREPIEQFRVLFLDTRNRLIADEAQGQGSVNHTPVYPREVIKRALELHATALILVHNHPSGDPTPSRADLEITAEIEDAGALMSIRVHDHFIIGNGATYSFRAHGHLGT